MVCILVTEGKRLQWKFQTHKYVFLQVHSKTPSPQISVFKIKMKLINWSCWSSGLSHHVILQVDANVSEEHTASIFSHDDGSGIFLQNIDIYL
jgi:hypothetical protein